MESNKDYFSWLTWILKTFLFLGTSKPIAAEKSLGVLQGCFGVIFFRMSRRRCFSPWDVWSTFLKPQSKKDLERNMPQVGKTRKYEVQYRRMILIPYIYII